MTTRPDDDDRELRDLLASIGVTEQSIVPARPTPADVEQVHRTMARIRSLPAGDAPAAARRQSEWSGASSRRSWAPRLVAVAAACALVALIVIQPWGGSQALAQTPAMLQFADVRAGEIPPSGDAAAELLEDLAARAAMLPEPADLPVQRIELDAWWSSSALTTNDGDASSALVSVRSVAYVFPNGDRRAIEYRGEPLDPDGRPIQGDLSWLTSPPVSDEIIALDPAMGPDYPQSLPEDPEDLVEALAPEAACGDRRGGCLLAEVAGILESYVVDPDVVARVWQALATESSITSLGVTVDRHGRDAVVLSAPSMVPGEQMLILVDPHTGSYLGSEHILVAPSEIYGFDPPAVLSFTSVVSAKRVAGSDMPDDSTATRY